MFSPKNRFRDYLKKKGLKFTPERWLILEKVFSLHGHFDADKVYDEMHKKNKKLSRATIYRTLPLLVESNLVKETLRYQKRATYEPVFGYSHHDHLICIKCNRVIEFRNDLIERLQGKVCKKYRFEPLEHRLGIKGYCQKCASKEQRR